MEVFIVLTLLLLILFKVSALDFDKTCIENYFLGHGETVVSINWRMLMLWRGVMWEFSQPGDGCSFYVVEYIDTRGVIQRVLCKTSLLGEISILEDDSSLKSPSTDYQPSTSEEKNSSLSTRNHRQQ